MKDITRKSNEMWVIWKSFFLDVLNKHAPLAKIRVKGNNLPFVTTEVSLIPLQQDHGQIMVDHGQTMVDHEMTIN